MVDGHLTNVVLKAWPSLLFYFLKLVIMALFNIIDILITLIQRPIVHIIYNIINSIFLYFTFSYFNFYDKYLRLILSAKEKKKLQYF